MHKDLIFQQAANVYFDFLAEEGKPPRINEVVDRLAREMDTEREMIKSILSDPEFDALLLAQRKRRLIEQVAFKIVAAEAAEKIGVSGLEKLTELIENGVVGNGKEADLTAKDLIAAVRLASDLNAQVDAGVKELTGTERPQINIEIKELIGKHGVDRLAAIMGEVQRGLDAPKAEVIDADSAEG